MVHHEVLCCWERDGVVVAFVGVAGSGECAWEPLLEGDVRVCAFVAEEVDVGVVD